MEPQCLHYFHPHLTSIEDVKRVMHPYIQDNGYYLLRISTTQERTYTMSVVHRDGLKHFKILKSGHHYYLQDHAFNSIDQLTKFYSINPVPNLEQVQHVMLKFPVINEERFGKHPSMSSLSSGSSLSSSFSESAFTDEPQTPQRRTLPSPPEIPRLQGNQKRSESQRQYMPRPILDPVNRRNSEPTRERPPLPLPPGSTDYGCNGVYYSRVKPQENHLDDLMKKLSVAGSEESTHCECGLDLELSQLPLGWTVHISKEPTSLGRPFFMNTEQTTSWELPRNVYLELKTHQQKFIKFLCENYEQGNDPPDKDTQMQFSSTSSSGSSTTNAPGPRSSFGGTSSCNRDSTGSNTGASSQPPQFVPRRPGVKDAGEAGAAS